MTGSIDTVVTELLSPVLGSVEDAEVHVLKFITSTEPQILTPCSRSDLDKIAQFQSAIDELHSAARVIRRAFERIESALSTAQNHSVNINTLPDELLSMIFAGAVDNSSDRGTVGILNLARTCKRWNQACMNSLEIWSVVHLPSESDQAKELLSLAKLTSRPIGTLTVPYPTIPVSFLPSFSSISYLIRRLDLQNWDNKMWLMGNFSSLQELLVRYGPPADDQHASPLGGIFQPIVGTQILTSVVLENCRLPYVPNCYRGLTALTITYQSMCWQNSHIYDEDGRLSDALRACPDLENLVLINLPMTTEEAIALARQPPELPRTIPLLRLRRLHLSLCTHALSGLLRHMETSHSLTKVDLDIYPSEAECNWANGSDVRTTLEPTLMDLDMSVCLPMLAQLDTMSIQFICHAPCMHKRLLASSVAPSPFILTLGRAEGYGFKKGLFGSVRSSWHHLYASTDRALSLRSVRTLHIHETGCSSMGLKDFFARDRQVGQFRALLPQMPHLRTLILSAKHYIDFLDTLVLVLARTRDPQSTQEPLAPDFDVLVVKRIWFRGADKDIPEFARLVGLLQVRQVYVEDCWVSARPNGAITSSADESERTLVDALRKEGVAFVRCSRLREGRPEVL